jgi:hypothetical protein
MDDSILWIGWYLMLLGLPAAVIGLFIRDLMKREGRRRGV